MRTLKGKRLWPVLAMTPVFALAAFLAFGLIAGNGVPTAHAQDPDCEVDTLTEGTPSADQSCTATGDMAAVEFSGTEDRGEDGAVTYLVYAKDGSIDGGTDVMLRLPGVDAAASTTPLSFKSLEIAGGTREPDGSITKSTGTIAVENLKGTDVEDGRATLYAYVDPGMGSPAVGSNQTLNTPEVEVTIVFLGVPVHYEDPEADPLVERSNLVAFPEGGSIDPDDELTAVLTGDVTGATVRATVQDMNGEPLPGEITFEAASEPPDVFGRVITKELEDDGTQVFELSDLPTDTRFRITVTATYDDGSDDGFLVGTATILRSGDLDSLTAAVCVTDMDNAEDEAGCPKGEKPQSVFTRDAGSFKVRATALDALDSPAADVEFSVTVPDEAKDFISNTANDTAETGMLIATIEIDEDHAVSGVYTLTVAAEQEQGSEDPIIMEADVEITISGDLTEYTLEGSDTIALGSIQTYTVSALDASGAPATIDSGNNIVTVFVSGPASGSIETLDRSATNEVTLNDEGVGTFRIFAKTDGAPGIVTITVIGISDTESVTKNVSIGNEAPTAVGDLDAVTLTLVDNPTTMVDASGAFTDADGDALSYMAESSDDAVATASVDDSGMVTITAVAAGMTTVTVTASDRHGASAMQTIEVTVEEAPGPGPVHEYRIEGLAIIPLDTIATEYTVKAVDEHGNTPVFDGDDRVTVVVRGIPADSVLDLDNGGLTLDADTGEATFTIVTPADAAKGDQAQIHILVGSSVKASLTVTFGGINRAPTAVGMLDAVMLTEGDPPAMVDASGAFTDADGDALSYMVESNNEDAATASVDADSGMVTITAVAAGMATVTVTASDPDGASATQDIAVTVEEPPVPDPLPVHEYRIEGDDVIPLTALAFAVYTVKAVDENGDVPAFADGNDRVTVLVEGISPDNVRDLDDGGLTLDAEDGEATFTIAKPADAAKGQTFDIGILVGGELVASKTVVFGAYNVIPSAVGTLDAVMLTEGDAPVMVDVSGAFTDDDMLSYMAESDDEAVATASVDAAGMVTITAVGVGTATVTVTASDPDGESATQDIAVTVAAAPVPPLGDPSGLSATSAAAGEATVTWTPGANATVHWVWSAPRDGSAGMWTEAAGDAGMATVSGLTSGADYWFIVIAGQAPADGGATKFSAWSNWSGLTTIQ